MTPHTPSPHSTPAAYTLSLGLVGVTEALDLTRVDRVNTGFSIDGSCLRGVERLGGEEGHSAELHRTIPYRETHVEIILESHTPLGYRRSHPRLLGRRFSPGDPACCLLYTSRHHRSLRKDQLEAELQ